MVVCETESFYDEIKSLIQELGDNIITDSRKSELIALLNRWDSIECPSACRPNVCLFGNPEDWISYYGYHNLFDLIESLEQDKTLDGIPHEDPGIDPLSISAKRRPGHFNP